jgi:hypothetical protein
MGYDEAKQAITEFWNSTIKPGLEQLWSYRTVVWNGMKEVAGYIWENILIVAKSVWNALEQFGSIVWSATKTGVAYLWDTGMYYLGSIIDALTPFIPISPLLKATLVIAIILLYIGFVIGVDEILEVIWKLFTFILHRIIQFGTEITHLLASIIGGELEP